MTEGIKEIIIREKKVFKLYPDGRLFPDKSKSSWWIEGMKEYIPPKKDNKKPEPKEQAPLFKTEKKGTKGF